MVLIGLMSTMVNDYSNQSVRIDSVNHYLASRGSSRSRVAGGP